MKKDKKELIDLLNSYNYRTLKDIKKDIERVLNHEENELKRKSGGRIYGIDNLIENIERKLKRAKELKDKASKIRKDN